MKKVIILFLILVFCGMFFDKVYAGQQAKTLPYWGPIMSCNTEKLIEGGQWLGAYKDPCSNFCDLLATLQNVLYLAISLALFAFAPILFVIVGIYYIISRGNVEKTKKAKDIFFNVIKGIVIVLLSFIIVNTLFVILAPKVPGVNFATWNQISCSPESVPGSNVPWIKKGQ